MFKFFKNLFGKKDEVVTETAKVVYEKPQKLEPVQEPVKQEPVRATFGEVVEEPVKVIKERLVEVAEKKVTAKEIKGNVKKTPVNADATTEETPVVKKPRRKRKPKPKNDKPADGEQK